MPFLRCGGAELLLLTTMNLTGEGLILLVDGGAETEEGETRSIFTFTVLIFSNSVCVKKEICGFQGESKFPSVEFFA